MGPPREAQDHVGEVGQLEEQLVDVPGLEQVVSQPDLEQLQQLEVQKVEHEGLADDFSGNVTSQLLIFSFQAIIFTSENQIYD